MVGRRIDGWVGVQEESSAVPHSSVRVVLGIGGLGQGGEENVLSSTEIERLLGWQRGPKQKGEHVLSKAGGSGENTE